jgi:hypothetical protein
MPESSFSILTAQEIQSTQPNALIPLCWENYGQITGSIQRNTIHNSQVPILFPLCAVKTESKTNIMQQSHKSTPRFLRGKPDAGKTTGP